MNERVRLSALFFLAVSVVSATLAGTAVAQPADPGAPAGAPPVVVEPAVPPAPPLSITAAPEMAAPTMVAAPLPPPPPAKTISPVKIDSPSTTIKFGLLAQPQYEALGSVGADKMSQNMFLRRTRLLVGGTLFGVVDYFIDTDSANLFKTNQVAGSTSTATPPVTTPPTTSAKVPPGMVVQDIFVTYKGLGDVLKVDAGYMLPPLAHNALQGAGSLLSLDYFTYSFQHSTAAQGFFGASGSSVGRDTGIQLRGLVLDGHLEYRAGLFQGVRNAPTAADAATGAAAQVGARNMFRATARVQVNFLDAEPGFFYAGTYFGAKKILSIGASADIQEHYTYWAADGFADLPVGPGVVTAQVNFAQWNAGDKTDLLGGAIIPKQTAFMGEAGYTISGIHISPIVRYDQLWTKATGGDQKRIGGGVAFWPYLHNSNLKVFYTRLINEGAPHGANQINLQWQVYFF